MYIGFSRVVCKKFNSSNHNNITFIILISIKLMIIKITQFTGGWYICRIYTPFIFDHKSFKLFTEFIYFKFLTYRHKMINDVDFCKKINMISYVVFVLLHT